MWAMDLAERLRTIVGPRHVLTDHHQLRTYESDGLLQYAAVPRAAVLPGTAEEVAAVVRACHAAGVPWVARGSGSGLSGGALPVQEGVLIVLSRLRRILDIDLANQRVVCEPGVTNLAISNAVGPSHFFPPDPSSQVVCSIGAIEMMDRLTIDASEQMAHAGWPPDAGAALLVELDGPEHECEALFDEVRGLCEQADATGVEVARDAVQREVFWKMRKAAFPAMGRISPRYYVQDSVIPRTRLGDVLERIDALAREYGLQVGNVFHAGDGNLHPLVCYGEGQAERAEELAGEIVRACVEAGGSITGEHGVGVDKKRYMPQMFVEPELAAFQKLRCGCDPYGLANPGKVRPPPRPCGEVAGRY